MQNYVPDIWAVDQSSRMLAQHPLKNTDKLRVGDALKLPFADNSFDLVYGWEVLHHISEPSLAVAEMARVSRRYVLVAEPNPVNLAQFLFALIDPEHRWVLRYKLSYMRNLFESVGLRVEHSSSGGWVFPNKTPLWLLPLLQRLPYRSPLGISNWVLGSKNALE
jgi:ubiquinone/menaquinone biosynthesis C-methylase UbiE